LKYHDIIIVSVALTILYAPSDDAPMETGSQGASNMGNSYKSAAFLMESRMADAAMGDSNACFELGIAYSSGAGGLNVDLIEAHKWFNLAALRGSERGQQCRAEIAEEMSSREIAEAQRQARAWLHGAGAALRAA